MLLWKDESGEAKATRCRLSNDRARSIICSRCALVCQPCLHPSPLAVSASASPGTRSSCPPLVCCRVRKTLVGAIADATACVAGCSRPVDQSRYGCIASCVQRQTVRGRSNTIYICFSPCFPLAHRSKSPANKTRRSPSLLVDTRRPAETHLAHWQIARGGTGKVDRLAGRDYWGICRNEIAYLLLRS